MNKNLLAAALSLAMLPALYAGNPFAEFDKSITAEGMKPFARDVGGLLGSGTYHTGKTLAFAEFDIGMHAVMQFKPSAGNSVMENNGTSSFGFPWFQAETGMPFNLEGFIRATSWNGLTVSGGGLRWGGKQVSFLPFHPQILVAGVGHAGVHRDFSVTHFGAVAVLSWSVRDLYPSLGIGVDRTRLVVREAPAGTGLVDAESVVTEPRFTLGLSYRPTQLVYLSAEANLLHGKPAVSGSVGVRF